MNFGKGLKPHVTNKKVADEEDKEVEMKAAPSSLPRMTIE